MLDPRADPVGNPAVELAASPVPGRIAVDIPPVVLVHRYYYNGDRSFRAPLLPGGPSILVLNHPGTGERLYLRANIPPGSPRVHYNRHEIRYDYGEQQVKVCFGLHGAPSVVYSQGVSAGEQIGEQVEHVTRSSGRWLKRTGLPAYAHGAGRAAVAAAETTADRINDISSAIIDPAVGLIQSTPLGSLTTSTPADRALRRRRSLLDRAESARPPTLDPELTLPLFP